MSVCPSACLSVGRSVGRSANVVLSVSVSIGPVGIDIVIAPNKFVAFQINP